MAMGGRKGPPSCYLCPTPRFDRPFTVLSMVRLAQALNLLRPHHPPHLAHPAGDQHDHHAVPRVNGLDLGGIPEPLDPDQIAGPDRLAPPVPHILLRRHRNRHRHPPPYAGAKLPPTRRARPSATSFSRCASTV